MSVSFAALRRAFLGAALAAAWTAAPAAQTADSFPSPRPVGRAQATLVLANADSGNR